VRGLGWAQNVMKGAAMTEFDVADALADVRKPFSTREVLFHSRARILRR
jgi:hypothetical protein